jgi:hypothetical protein
MPNNRCRNANGGFNPAVCPMMLDNFANRHTTNARRCRHRAAGANRVAAWAVRIWALITARAAELIAIMLTADENDRARGRAGPPIIPGHQLDQVETARGGGDAISCHLARFIVRRRTSDPRADLNSFGRFSRRLKLKPTVKVSPSMR